MNYLPIAVKLKNKRAVVVGGGLVAQRKVRTLLSAGARVLVIAPALTRDLRQLVKQSRVTARYRAVRQSDIKNAHLVVAATNDMHVNDQVSRWARIQGISINVVDQPSRCDFISPAILRFKRALVAVYTDGRDPVLSRDLKNYLKENWDDFVSYRNRL